MIRHQSDRFRYSLFGLVLLQLQHVVVGSVLAGEPPRRVGRTIAVTRAQPCPAPRPTSSLGTFYPTPYITVRGNIPLGGGYSPLEIYGDQTLALYGPLSPLRVSTAPVLTYVRGYDGRTHLTEASSFSNPNLPILSPVRYPTVGNYFYGPRVIRTTPWGSNAINWIDQN
jgi:hypothetical protein